MEIMDFWKIRKVKRAVKDNYVRYAKEEGITLAKALEKRQPKK
jgi:hypothetical protein